MFKDNYVWKILYEIVFKLYEFRLLRDGYRSILSELKKAHGMRCTFLLAMVFLAVSCSQRGMIDGVRLEYVSPDKTVSLAASSRLALPEVMRCYAIQLIQDTILVLQDRATEDNIHHFKAYSVNSSDYLGAFVRLGRGPGETISPHVVKSAAYAEWLILNDNAMRKAWAVDVVESTVSGSMIAADLFELPAGVVDWTILPDSCSFSLRLDHGKVVFHTEDGRNSVLNSYSLNDAVDSEQSLIYLSGFLTDDGVSGKVAEAMVFFPQINIFDTKAGLTRSLATSKACRYWKTVVSGMPDMSTVEYYEGIAATEDYIFAAYRGVPLGRLDEPGPGSSIHILDWNGDFLYDVRVDENIGDIAFDERTQRLYCIDRLEGGVVVYDLDALNLRSPLR